MVRTVWYMRIFLKRADLVEVNCAGFEYGRIGKTEQSRRLVGGKRQTLPKPLAGEQTYVPYRTVPVSQSICGDESLRSRRAFGRIFLARCVQCVLYSTVRTVVLYVLYSSTQPSFPHSRKDP